MDLIHAPAHEATGDAAIPMSRAALAVLWVFGIAAFALVLAAAFLAYLDPAMLIEFASLRLCG